MNPNPPLQNDLNSIRAMMRRHLGSDGWRDEPSAVDRLANIAYSDSLKLCRQLYERQLALQNQLRTMARAWHDDHCKHLHLSFDGCYRATCVFNRKLLAEAVVPDAGQLPGD